MPFVKEYNKDFRIEGECLRLTPQFFEKAKPRFKKITGSRIAGILGLSPYNSPVQAWAGMVNIYKDDIDPVLARAGTIIEPKIRDLASKRLNLSFKTYEPAKVNWDVFAENKIFGGIPDGEPVDASGRFLYPAKPMLEIKTSSIDRLVYKKINGQLQMVLNERGMPIVKQPNGKRAEWFAEDGKIAVKDEYKLQLSLYLHLRNIEYGIFAVCFLKTEDYADPEACDVTQREVRFVELVMKREQMEKIVQKASRWYNDHIMTGVSPQLTVRDYE